ncbi:MAG TPA: SdrD B-like domain-containing protein [Burkholderiaceae bacterium]|nr:SdrD B-like domain-containing protein [Burkholderiaceae bacterium]
MKKKNVGLGAWGSRVAMGGVLALGSWMAVVHADPFPPMWGTGTPNEAAGPIHFAPVAWPNEPADPKDCGQQCGGWQPYTRFQTGLQDPRVQDPSNGGTSPQNYVNVSSSCIDKSLPSIYTSLRKGAATDGSQDVLMFRWRVEQIANNYGTGPSAGSYGATDPWSSALWTVLFDIDGDGYRDVAAHLNGSSGGPSTPIDMIAGIWGNLPTQSIDYLNDPNIRVIAHNPTAFVGPDGKLMNFQNQLTPTTQWPAGSATNTWDYGTSRSRLVYTNSCTEYFVDYQIPVRMLDASATSPNPALRGMGGPKITRDTPISMLFCTANSLNNPFQKDCALNASYIGNVAKPAPFGDYLSFNKQGAYAQPIVSSVAASPPQTCGPGASYALSARVQDTLYVDGNGEARSSVKQVQFFYWYDADGDGTTAGDAGSAWTLAADASLKPGTLNTWVAAWNASGLLKGRYLIGVQAVDDRTKHDRDVPDAPVDNRTFSYIVGSTAVDTQAQVYSNRWTWDGTAKTWQQGAPVGWLSGQQAAFPSHQSAPVPGTAEDWYGNPDVTGTQIATTGVDLAVNSCGIAPTITKTSSAATVTAGGAVDFTITVGNPAANSAPVRVGSLQDSLPAGFAYAGPTSGDFGAAAPMVAGQVLGWSFDPAVSISPGTSKSLTFRTTATSVVGSYNNSASAVTDLGTIASEPVQVQVGAPRLSIAKTPSRYSAVPGDSITYTISYANDSPVNVAGVVVRDTLPTGLTLVPGSCVPACTVNGSQLSWAVGNLAAGQGPLSVSFTATVESPYPAGGTVPNVNTASIESPSTATATASASVFVATPRAQLSLSKTASKTLVVPGVATNDGTGTPSNRVTFGLAYANVGNATAVAAVLSDPLPAGFTYVSASPTPASAPAVGSSGTVSWNLGDLAAGASGSVSVVAQVANTYTSGPNPVTNTASLGATGLSAVQASASVGIQQTAQICTPHYFTDQPNANNQWNKEARLSTTGLTASTVSLGFSSTSYVELARFYQEDVADSTTLFRDAAGVLSANVSISGNAYVQKSSNENMTFKMEVYDYDPVVGEVSKRRIAASSDVAFNGNSGSNSFTLTVDTYAGQTTELRKDHKLLVVVSGRLTGAGSTTASISVNLSPKTATNVGYVEVCSLPPANLTLNKSVSQTSLNVAGTGRQLSYTLNYANTSGATDATGVTLVDSLPAGVTFVSASDGGSHNSGTVTWTVGTVAKGSSGTRTVTVSVPDDLSAYSSLLNTATIRSDQTADVSATAGTAVVGGGDPAGTANVVLSKAANTSLLQPGGAVTFTLTALNAGTANATNVVLSDVLSSLSHMSYVPGSTRLNGQVVPDGVAGGTLSVNAGTLVPGGTAVLAFDMQVAASGLPAGITVVNNSATAQFSGCASVPCSAASNTVSVSVSTNPNLGLSKTASAPADAQRGFQPGETVTYQVTVSNSGSGAASDVVVSDPLPAYLSYVSGGQFDAVNNRVVLTLPTLAGGASQTLSFTTRVQAPLPNGQTTLLNLATASASNASTRTASVSSLASAAPRLALSKTGPASLPYPAGHLSASVNAATVLYVDGMTGIEAGAWVRLGSGLGRVLAVNANSLTLDPGTPLSGAQGDALTVGAAYQLSYRNDGNATATSVTLTDTPPAGWLYAAASPTPGTAPTPGTTGPVNLSLGDLAPGQGGTVTVHWLPTGPGTATNQASLSDAVYCTGATPPAACASSATTAVGGLTVSKRTTTPTAVAGGTARYEITVRNQLATAVAGVEVVDLLPSGFSYATTVSTGGNGATRSITVEPSVGDAQPRWGGWILSGGGELTITFDAALSASVGPATYQNELALSATTPGVAIAPFDALSTTDEDVTVLAAGTGLVAGRVYRDNNANGLFDAATDTPLPGVAVTILDATSTAYVVYTDPNGRFSRVVAAGAAVLDVDDGSVPDGLALTSGSDGVDPSVVTVPDGGATERNTGYVVPGTAVGQLQGLVWNDADGDATVNGGESGRLGVAVRLRGAGGTLSRIAYTDVLGRYDFGALAAGSYQVELVLPDGWRVTTPAGTQVNAGVTAPGTTTVDFGLLATGGSGPVCSANAVVSGRLWRDTNRNLYQDVGEALLADVRVPVLLIPQQSGLGATRLTVSSAGLFRFEGVLPGTYLIQVQDANLNQVHRLYPVDSSLATVTVAACDTLVREFAYGPTPGIAVSGQVWLDVNRDGIKNEWLDANNDGLVTANNLDTIASFAQWEWLDLNGNGRHDLPEDRGELNSCGLAGDLAQGNVFLQGPNSQTRYVIAGQQGDWRTRPDWGYGLYRATLSRTTALDDEAAGVTNTGLCKPLPVAQLQPTSLTTSAPTVVSAKQRGASVASGPTLVQASVTPASLVCTGAGVQERTLSGLSPIADDMDLPMSCTDAATPVATMTVRKTIYLGHDSGASCPSATQSAVVVNKNRVDQPVTWCVSVANTGTLDLSAPVFDDAALGVTPGVNQSRFVLRAGSSLPLAPGATAYWYVEEQRQLSLRNTVSVRMTPTQGGLQDLQGADDAGAVFGYVFDPPFGVKVGTVQSSTVIRWTMVWVNDNPIVANDVVITDPPPTGMTAVGGSLSCSPFGVTTVSACSFEPPSQVYPRGRVHVVANFGSDFGVTVGGINTATNRLEISFLATIDQPGANQTFNNQGTATWTPTPGQDLTGVTYDASQLAALDPNTPLVSLTPDALVPQPSPAQPTPVASQPIPALSFWALLALALAMGWLAHAQRLKGRRGT